MANEMSQIEVQAYDYVQVLTGKDSIMHSTKQTSVRLEINNLAKIDALAEMGKRSRNQLINDALGFGLDLILDQFEDEDMKLLSDLIRKQLIKLTADDESGVNSKEKQKEVVK